MYEAYGVKGTGFSWSAGRSARRSSRDSNVWLLEDGSRIVVEEDAAIFPESMSREDREGFKAAYEEMTGGSAGAKVGGARTAKVSEIESVEAAVSGPKYPDVTKITLTIEETGQKVLADVRYNGTEFAYDYKFNYHTLPQVNAYANAWLEGGRAVTGWLPACGRQV